MGDGDTPARLSHLLVNRNLNLSTSRIPSERGKVESGKRYTRTGNKPGLSAMYRVKSYARYEYRSKGLQCYMRGPGGSFRVIEKQGNLTLPCFQGCWVSKVHRLMGSS